MIVMVLVFGGGLGGRLVDRLGGALAGAFFSGVAEPDADPS
jgi:energy-converting hydrogenase Eha subunit B